MSLEFFLTSLVVIILPGTGVLYTIATGISRGFKASLAAAAGCTFGIVPAATASILGLAAIFHTSALAFVMIKYLGAVYLFYMAWNILREGGAMQIEEHTSQNNLSFWRIAVSGTMINILNPKLSLFFLAFLPQFLPTSQSNSISSLAYLAVFFMLMTFIVFVLYGAFASLARTYVIDSPAIMKWLKRGFAGTFGFLGLKLALAER